MRGGLLTRSLRLDALPEERPEGPGHRPRAGGSINAGRDIQPQPLERERAAVHDDSVEVRHIVARMDVVVRVGGR
jgi:hypothetical protein